jgi:tRNA modification GTPase
LDLADRAFRPNLGQRLSKTTVGRLRVGRIGSGLGDEVVAVVVAGLDSEEVEIQCHGGPSAVGLVVEALVSSGAKVRSPRAWLRHSGRSAIQADAELALASASTARVAEILLDQVNGAFEDELRRIGESSNDEALTRLDALIGRADFGLRLVEGWRVVLAGRPNVGKSRLLNALAGYDRAIVAPEAGTTRDVVTVRSAIGGWPVELADTAGLRETLDPIEAQGVSLARNHQRSADLVLVVLDRSEPLTKLDRAILADHPRALTLANKADLPQSWEEWRFGAVAISAERGDGVESLVEIIGSRLVANPPPAGEALPTRSGQVRRLQAIRQCYRSGRADRARRSLERWIGSKKSTS